MSKRGLSDYSGRAALYLWTLYTLSLAHPLYAVLQQADHAPFFIAHQVRSIDVWLFVALLSFALPMVLCLTLWVIQLVSARLVTFLYLLLMFLLFLLVWLPVPESWFDTSANLTIGLSLLAAAICTALYVYTAWARSFLAIMSLAIIVSPLLFLSSASIRSFTATPEARDFTISPRSENRPNIVMIVFDELPLISLLDENHDIDLVRYPNFYRLAQTATWFRNTATVHYSTMYAITSLLVGDEFENYLERVHPDGNLPKGPVDRKKAPYSLFSLLEPEYQIYATELNTKLAPPVSDDSEYVTPLNTRLRDLLLDSAVVYSHIVTPKQMRGTLPPIEGQWQGFEDPAPKNSLGSDWPYEDSFKRTSAVQKFIESIRPRNLPSFYYLHTLLPHFPFVYNERSQLHENKLTFLNMQFREATGANIWPSEHAADLAYQAHLLQLGFTDVLLGRVLDRLESQNIFDDTIIIVTSDHGTNYYWDEKDIPSNRLEHIQASGTVFVPLIIKQPGQSSKEVIATPTSILDIVPTLADLLGMPVPWPVVGVSALGPVQQNRKRVAKLPQPLEVAQDLEPGGEALERKLALFGDGDFSTVYRYGPRTELIGKSLEAFASRPSKGVIHLRPPGPNFLVNPSASHKSLYVNGQILVAPDELGGPDIVLVVAVNGVIRATTISDRIDISSLRAQNSNSNSQAVTTNFSPGELYFLTLLPSNAFSEGRNEITIHAVIPKGTSGEISLLDFNYE